MVIKNKIWEEMKQAHANVLCVKWYTDKQRKHERYYQMFIALVASGGTFGYLLNEIAPLISSSIIAFVSMAKTPINWTKTQISWISNQFREIEEVEHLAVRRVYPPPVLPYVDVRYLHGGVGMVERLVDGVLVNPGLVGRQRRPSVPCGVLLQVFHPDFAPQRLQPAVYVFRQRIA